MANDAADNVIETRAHKGRVVRFDDCEIASSRGIRYELSTAEAARFWPARRGQEQTVRRRRN